MSGIYIKCMEMPKSCYACRMLFQDQDSEHNCYWRCSALNHEEIVKSTDERHPNCPLVSVPTPHGRLIDADDMESITIDCDARGNWKRINAPTIIESEE